MSSVSRHTRAASVGQARLSAACPSETVPQTPWRKISTGIALAFKTRRSVKLSDRTNIPDDGSSEEVARRFVELVQSPAHLRLMTKSQLQSVAVIVNDSLPERQRVETWKRNKEELRNALEDVFGFPRTETPKAPRRSSENSRFSGVSYPPALPVTPMLLASPKSATRKRHSTGGITATKTHTSCDDTKCNQEDPFTSILPSVSASLRTSRSPPAPPRTIMSISRVPVLRKSKAPKTVQMSKPISQHPQVDISTLTNAMRSPPRVMRSSSPLTTEAIPPSSSPPSSPLASRSTQSSINRLATSQSDISTAGYTSPGVSRSNSHNNIASSINHSSSSTDLGSGGTRLGGAGAYSYSYNVRLRGTAAEYYQIMAEDLTVALLASRMSADLIAHQATMGIQPSNAVVVAQTPNQTSSGHTRTTSTRSGGSGPRMSWMSTQNSRRFLDVVREEEDEDEDEDDEDSQNRPKKRRRTPEPSTSSSYFTAHTRSQSRITSLTNSPSNEFTM